MQYNYQYKYMLNPGYAGSSNSSETQSKKGRKGGKKAKGSVPGFTVEGTVTGGTRPFITKVSANQAKHVFNIPAGVDAKFTKQRQGTCPSHQYDSLVTGEVGFKVTFQIQAGLWFTLTKSSGDEKD